MRYYKSKVKMRMRFLFLLLLLFAVRFTSVDINACTSLIVSGKATADGRPLIFKNRDTPNPDNAAVVVKGERYYYVAIVNASDPKPREAWGGHNEVGFAIINTAAYNLNGCDNKSSDGDGIVMRRALEICRTLKDFETLLDTLPKPMDVNSNFGVIDAEGGCAYYETGNSEYVKFDANNPADAPNGYILRTNFGHTGCRDADEGVERFMAITDFMNNVCDRPISHQQLITRVPRYLTHGLTKINLYDIMPKDESDVKMFPFLDFIPRWSTSSAILVQGVRNGENPMNTVSWINIGWPLASVAMPVMICRQEKLESDGSTGIVQLPSVITHGEDGSSWLCRKAMEQKRRVFSAGKGHSHDYIDISKLINAQQTGIAQRAARLEEEVLKRGNRVVDMVRKEKKGYQRLSDYYIWVDDYLKSKYPE